MCVKILLDCEEMMQVTDVGENKFEKYGDRFLDGIYEVAGGKNITLAKKKKLFL